MVVATARRRRGRHVGVMEKNSELAETKKNYDASEEEKKEYQVAEEEEGGNNERKKTQRTN